MYNYNTRIEPFHCYQINKVLPSVKSTLKMLVNTRFKLGLSHIKYELNIKFTMKIPKKHLKMPLTHSIWLWWAIGVTTFLNEKKFTKAIHILKPIWQNLHAIMGSKQEIWAKKEESLQNILGNAFNSLNLAVMSHWRHNLLEWVRAKSIASIFTEESNPRTN